MSSSAKYSNRLARIQRVLEAGRVTGVTCEVPTLLDLRLTQGDHIRTLIWGGDEDDLLEGQNSPEKALEVARRATSVASLEVARRATSRLATSPPQELA